MKTKNFKTEIVKDYSREELEEELFRMFKENTKLKKEWFALFEKFLEMIENYDTVSTKIKKGRTKNGR